jgi:hypothetical protein
MAAGLKNFWNVRQKKKEESFIFIFLQELRRPNVISQSRSRHGTCLNKKKVDFPISMRQENEKLNYAKSQQEHSTSEHQA